MGAYGLEMHDWNMEHISYKYIHNSRYSESIKMKVFFLVWGNHVVINYNDNL